MLIINDDMVHRSHFDSVLDAVNYLETTPYKWRDRAPMETGHYYASKSWTLGHDHHDILRFAKDGWEDGIREVELLGRPVPNNRMNSWRADVAGETVDIGRYIAGAPTCMRRRANVHGRRPIVSIFINNWINGCVNADQMVKFGAALVAAIDQIENSGKRVELTVGCVAPTRHNQKKINSATWVVKRAEDHLDLGALAFSVAHPGASRRFGWRIWGHSAAPTDNGFGLAVNWTCKPEHLVNPHHDLLIIAGLNGYWDRCKTMEDAKLLVAKQINDAYGDTIVEL